jgi:hypothetical protein
MSQHITIDGVGHASRSAVGAAKLLDEAFKDSTNPAGAFAYGVGGTAAGLLALAPVIAISLPVIAVASVAVGVTALFKKLLT